MKIVKEERAYFVYLNCGSFSQGHVPNSFIQANNGLSSSGWNQSNHQITSPVRLEKREQRSKQHKQNILIIKPQIEATTTQRKEKEKEIKEEHLSAHLVSSGKAIFRGACCSM